MKSTAQRKLSRALADNAYFAIQRGSSFYKVRGSNLSKKLQTGDILCVLRGTSYYKFTYAGHLTGIRDTDYLACLSGSAHFKISGRLFKETVDPGFSVKSDVVWNIDSSKHISITRDAVFTGGVEPYTVETIFEIVYSDNIESLDFTGSYALNAETAGPGGLHCIIHGSSSTSTGESVILAYDTKKNTLEEVYRDFKVCSRWGIRKAFWNCSAYAFLQDNKSRPPSGKGNQLVFEAKGDKCQVTRLPEGWDWALNTSANVGMITGMAVSADRTKLYASRYLSGIREYDLQFNEDGTIDWDYSVKNNEKGNLVGKRNDLYYKGSSQDPETGVWYFSHQTELLIFDLWGSWSTDIPGTSADCGMSDNNGAVSICITDDAIFRTICRSDGTYFVTRLIKKNGSPINLEQDVNWRSDGSLIFSNYEGEIIYKVTLAEPVKYILKHEDSSQNSSAWRQLPDGEGPQGSFPHGTVTAAFSAEDKPFSMVWYAPRDNTGGSHQVWGTTPQPGSEARVKQIGTDSDSPPSTATSYPPAQTVT